MGALIFVPHGAVINIFGGRCVREASIFIFASNLVMKGKGQVFQPSVVRCNYSHSIV